MRIIPYSPHYWVEDRTEGFAYVTGERLGMLVCSVAYLFTFLGFWVPSIKLPLTKTYIFFPEATEQLANRGGGRDAEIPSTDRCKSSLGWTIQHVIK